eukprot:scaffold279737_cov17-Tisochrysis_lutea.AAC.1
MQVVLPACPAVHGADTKTGLQDLTLLCSAPAFFSSCGPFAALQKRGTPCSPEWELLVRGLSNQLNVRAGWKENKTKAV